MKISRNFVDSDVEKTLNQLISSYKTNQDQNTENEILKIVATLDINVQYEVYQWIHTEAPSESTLRNKAADYASKSAHSLLEYLNTLDLDEPQ